MRKKDSFGKIRAFSSIMLCGLENTKNTRYTEVTQASKNFLLIFNTSFINKSRVKFRNQKFDLVRLCLIIFVCRVRFHSIVCRTQLSSIEIQFIGFD